MPGAGSTDKSDKNLLCILYKMKEAQACLVGQNVL